jgi:hypothetical protein
MYTPEQADTIPLRSILILSSGLYIGVLNNLLPSEFSTQHFVYGYRIFPHACYMPHTSHHPNNIWRELQMTRRFGTWFSPASLHIQPLFCFP